MNLRLDHKELMDALRTALKKPLNKAKAASLFCLALMLLASLNLSSVSATSSGYERYKDNDCEVFLEYLPIVPYNPSYPTASEEFAIKFHFWQNAWYYWIWNWGFYYMKMVPRAFTIRVYYRDDSCGSSNYVTWKRWLPTTVDQYGLTISWSLSGGYGPLTLQGSVSGPTVYGYNTYYTKYYESYGGKTYLHVGKLWTEYASTPYWGGVDVYGGGSIGIPNDAAQSHSGHHILVRVWVQLVWNEYDVFGDILGLRPNRKTRDYNFVLGDDVPWETDAWITVQQGDTNYSEW